MALRTIARTPMPLLIGGDETLENATLLIRDERIVEVGTAESPTTGYFVIDLGGITSTPAS